MTKWAGERGRRYQRSREGGGGWGGGRGREGEWAGEVSGRGGIEVWKWGGGGIYCDWKGQCVGNEAGHISSGGAANMTFSFRFSWCQNIFRSLFSFMLLF